MDAHATKLCGGNCDGGMNANAKMWEFFQKVASTPPPPPPTPPTPPTPSPPTTSAPTTSPAVSPATPPTPGSPTPATPAPTTSPAVSPATPPTPGSPTPATPAPTTSPAVSPASPPTPSERESPSPPSVEGPAPTPAPATFTVSLKLTSLDDFDVEEFTEGMAKAMDMSASDVAVTESLFAMSTTMTFSTAITQAQLEATAAAVASANGVPTERVSLSFSSRRLGSETRRLESHEGSKVNAKILIPTSDKAKAAAIKDSVASPTALAEVAKALDMPASAISAEKVTISVEAKTIATTKGAIAVQAPTAAKLLEGLKEAAPGKTFVVTDVGEASVTEKGSPTPPPSGWPAPTPPPSGWPAPTPPPSGWRAPPPPSPEGWPAPTPPPSGWSAPTPPEGWPAPPPSPAGWPAPPAQGPSANGAATANGAPHRAVSLRGWNGAVSACLASFFCIVFSGI
eukprot:TRINITY_DN3141_c0_g1_i7.p1 TRINITY_DN3141_c0_g1~~TRINITY_DN3141_c0_g1_i7.p1  ORF type:complete len:464 (-),score=78.72 TRINITY_DN3141_c0_g1_i7:126-1490(-)